MLWFDVKPAWFFVWLSEFPVGLEHFFVYEVAGTTFR